MSLIDIYRSRRRAASLPADLHRPIQPVDHDPVEHVHPAAPAALREQAPATGRCGTCGDPLAARAIRADCAACRALGDA